MKERPILFADWEVRATLALRKTQFRRVMKDQPGAADNIRWNEERGVWQVYGAGGVWLDAKCPHGVVGDRLSDIEFTKPETGR